MRKHNGMRPQDVVVLLKIITLSDSKWTFAEIATALQLSETEISFVMERNAVAGLVSNDKMRVNKLALRDFLIYGLRYVFPPQPGNSTRGIATAHSAPPVSQRIAKNGENYVWKYYKGTRRGNSIEPLYDKIPKIVENQPELYEFLTIVDTLRIGKKREIEIAIEELDKRLNSYGG
jgi:DNA-binding Lrp family transcriptional regulator